MATTIQRFRNTKNERLYYLEFGQDLFGDHFVSIRYGINLGIARTYLFDCQDKAIEKANDVKKQRIENGYSLVA